MSAVALLDRLTHVKQTGPRRWIARCSAHPDHSPSLSIRELDDGRVLVHDFGGCETGDVLAAVGLRMSDLFEKRLGEFPASRSCVPAADLLALADHEILVATLLLEDVVKYRRISQNQLARLKEAAARIGRIRDHARS